ncbi:MAG: HepT-like ribonuclease domain-containing protein [Thermodesulfobacteriota bacterium]
MRPDKDDRLYRIHIGERIARIESSVGQIDQDTFLLSPLIQDAVLKNLQVLAESFQRLSESFKRAHPQVEWHKIAGLWNILVHDYLGIDLDIVWNILAEELLVLKAAVDPGSRP